MQGKRHDPVDTNGLLEPGEYGKFEGVWYCRAPHDTDDLWLTGNLSNHQVVEHEDGTITVSPSILISHWTGASWHGYLERGVWREV